MSCVTASMTEVFRATLRRKLLPASDVLTVFFPRCQRDLESRDYARLSGTFGNVRDGHFQSFFPRFARIYFYVIFCKLEHCASAFKQSDIHILIIVTSEVKKKKN